jgi:hypothetical protein
VAHSVGGGVLDISLADISLHADRPTRALILTAMRHDFDKEDDRPAKASSAEQNAADFREHRAAILGTRDHSGPYALTGLVFTTVAAGLVAYLTHPSSDHVASGTTRTAWFTRRCPGWPSPPWFPRRKTADLRRRAVQGPQPNRTGLQPVEAIPGRRHSLRQTPRPLPRHRDHRLDHDMAPREARPGMRMIPQIH